MHLKYCGADYAGHSDASYHEKRYDKRLQARLPAYSSHYESRQHIGEYSKSKGSPQAILPKNNYHSHNKGSDMSVPIMDTRTRFTLAVLAMTFAMPAILGQRINRAKPTEATSDCVICILLLSRYSSPYILMELPLHRVMRISSH